MTIATIATIAIILAAGKSSRMKSDKSKVLHKIGHRSLIGHVLALTEQAVVVVSPESKDIQEEVLKSFPGTTFAIQDPPLGTGHAVKTGFDTLPEIGENILILYGDTPLLTKETIDQLLASNAHCTLLAMEPRNPDGYGRIVQDIQGNVLRIVEHNDASLQERDIQLCFGGAMVIKAELLKTFLPKIENHNAKKEYYLVTLVELLSHAGHSVSYITTDEEELMGVNDRSQLAAAEHVFQTRMRNKALQAGVTLCDPTSTYFAYDTVLESDVTLEPHVYFGPGVRVKKGASIRAFSHIEGAEIGENCAIGPFARIRPKTILEPSSKVGNFVEIKNAHLKSGSKVNHLSYIGDATVGKKTNIGAGTITCNYDGFHKHQTIIGDDVSIGANSSLVAPLIIEDAALIGAGSVITKNVSKGSMALERGIQKEIQGGATHYRRKRSKD